LHFFISAFLALLQQP